MRVVSVVRAAAALGDTAHGSSRARANCSRRHLQGRVPSFFDVPTTAAQPYGGGRLPLQPPGGVWLPPTPLPAFADCSTSETAWSCLGRNGCIWCYESRQQGWQKPRCQGEYEVCERRLRTANQTDVPVDNIPEASGEVKCSDLTNCRQCLRFSYQCRWCLEGGEERRLAA